MSLSGGRLTDGVIGEHVAAIRCSTAPTQSPRSGGAALLRVSVWDRLFGSFRTREHYEDIRFGIGAYDGADWHTPLRLLALPLKPVRPGSA